MHRFAWAIFYLSLAFCLAAFITLLVSLGRPAEASTALFGQYDDSTATSSLNYNLGPFYGYVIPASVSGILESVQVAASADSSGQSLDAQILCYTDFARTTACPADWGDGSGNLYSDGGSQSVPNGGGVHIYTFTYTGYSSSLRTMYPDRYYVLEFQGASSHLFVWGSPSGVPYYVFSGASADLTTRIIGINSPADGATLAGNVVPFSFTYFFNSASSTYDTAGLTITDITAGQNIVPPPSESITADGESTYSESLTLTSGHSYTWSPFLSGGTDSPLNGLSYSFTLSGGATSTTAQIPDFFQGIWAAIQNNPPFGFIFQLKDQLDNLNASSSPAVSLELPTWEEDNVIHPFDLGLAGLLGLLFARWAFKRFVHFEF